MLVASVLLTAQVLLIVRSLRACPYSYRVESAVAPFSTPLPGRTSLLSVAPTFTHPLRAAFLCPPPHGQRARANRCNDRGGSALAPSDGDGGQEGNEPRGGSRGGRGCHHVAQGDARHLVCHTGPFFSATRLHNVFLLHAPLLSTLFRTNALLYLFVKVNGRVFCRGVASGQSRPWFPPALKRGGDLWPPQL